MPTLFGRDREIAMVTRALAAPRAIVTVRGPPGVGKSAVARAAAPTATILSLDRPDEPAFAGEIGPLLLVDGVDNAMPQAIARVEEQVRAGGKVLVTGYMPLGIDGETVVDIAPLTLEESLDLVRDAATRA